MTLRVVGGARNTASHTPGAGYQCARVFADGVSGDNFRAPDGNIYNRVDPKDSFGWGFDIGVFAGPNAEAGIFLAKVFGVETTRRRSPLPGLPSRLTRSHSADRQHRRNTYDERLRWNALHAAVTCTVVTTTTAAIKYLTGPAA